MKRITLVLIGVIILIFPFKATASELGYFTSKAELDQVIAATQSNNELQQRIDSIVNFAGQPNEWPYADISGAVTVQNGDCVSAQDSTNGPEFLRYNKGARLTYSKLLSYFFTNNQEYAQVARDNVMALTSTTTFGGDEYSGANQCILELAFSMPVWIQIADLLEHTPVWSNTDKAQFQAWLASEVYPKVAWASRRRSNNWGAAGSASAAMISDYVEGSVSLLQEVEPVAQSLTPNQAISSHLQQQKDRMSGAFEGDTRCEVWGIQSYGGIPDELRRGVAGCAATAIQADDSSLTYQITHTDFLMLTAEFEWHRGQTSIYDQALANNVGSLKQAIYFVISNPNNATDIEWEGYKLGHLYLPWRYYGDSVIGSVASQADEDTRGTFIPFASVTHYLLDSQPPIFEVEVQLPSPIPSASPETSPSPSSVTDCQKADLHVDGLIDLRDYTILAANYFETEPDPPTADIDDSGRVDLPDYTFLSAYFFERCE